MNPPTIKDVAKEAGVSLGTVSNVLNNRSSVKDENRELVVSAIKKLGFRSNMAARTLKTKTSKNIGLIIPSINNPYYPELARGVEDTANKLGLTVFLCNDDRDLNKEYKYIEALTSKNIDGIIFVKPQISIEKIKELCRESSVVFVDAEVPLNSGYNAINIDDCAGVIKALELLSSYGHTKIAFISGLLESQSSRKRYEAFLNYFYDKGIGIRDGYVVKGDYNWNSGYQAAQSLLLAPIPPTAIFAANDLMAIGAMKAIQDKGLSIPRDISVIGFDNIDFSEICIPSLTTIHQPKYQVGMESVNLLHKCLNTTEKTVEQKGEIITLETKTVFRQSVGHAYNI